MATNIKKTIMRRVYYSYALSIATSAALWQGALLGVSIALFGRLTHVAAIYRNFAATTIENVPAFIWNSFVHALYSGEAMTALVVVLMVGLTLKLIQRLVRVWGASRHIKVA